MKRKLNHNLLERRIQDWWDEIKISEIKYEEAIEIVKMAGLKDKEIEKTQWTELYGAYDDIYAHVILLTNIVPEIEHNFNLRKKDTHLFDIGDIVKLKTDIDSKERIVLGYQVTPGGTQYILGLGDKSGLYYEIEIQLAI